MTDNNLVKNAYQANLDQTKIKSVDIPLEDQKFVELTKNYWKLNKRSEEFVYEYNHPYKNHEYLVETIKQISIGDFWFYKSLECQCKVFEQILRFYNELFNEVKKDIFIEKLTRIIHGNCNKMQTIWNCLIQKKFWRT